MIANHGDTDKQGVRRGMRRVATATVTLWRKENVNSQLSKSNREGKGDVDNINEP